MILAFEIFDFNLAGKITPVSIAGMVLLAVGVILMLSSRAIANAISAKRERKSAVEGAEKVETGDADESENTERDGTEDIAAREAANPKDIERNIYRNEDGTRDHYTILKMAAMLVTIVGCLMTILGLN